MSYLLFGKAGASNHDILPAFPIKFLMMSVILKTKRLILREFVVTDATFMLTLMNDPTWLKYIGDRKVHTIFEAEQYLLKGALNSYRVNGYGFYLVLLRDTLEPIGTCGLAKRDFLEAPDFGFAFLPAYTGHGLAFEVAKANLEFARDELGISELLAITLPENGRSNRLLERLGFSFDQARHEDGEEVSLYRITL